jgi:thiol-disulfide isomerase/thioredoxin
MAFEPHNFPIPQRFSQPLLRYMASWCTRIGALLTMWLLAICAPAMASAQTTGDQLLERCIKATAKVRSLQADISVQGAGKFQYIQIKGSLRLEKPNRGRIELTTTESGGPIRRTCDGTLLTYFVDSTHYVLEEASDDGDNLARDCRCNEPLYFFRPEELRIVRSTGSSMQEEGVERIGGVSCKVLRLAGGPEGITLRLYVGPGDVIYGTDALTQRDGSLFGFRSRLTNVKVNPRFAPGAFHFEPQKTELAYVSGPPGPALRTIRRLSKMPDQGTIVRDFTLNSLEGKATTLFEVLRSHKVTILNFWGLGCPPCRMELPLLNANLAEWQSKGIGVLSVNLTDQAEAVQKVWKEEKLSVPVLLKGEGVASLFGVFAIPTTVLLDTNGKVLDTIVGVDMHTLDTVLQNAVGK